MAFNDQVSGLSGNTNQTFIFKEGVKYKRMSGAQILFRMMPAFNPADPNPSTSWLPCMDPNGNLTDWGAIIKLIRFVGHGNDGPGSRVGLLSLKTFETPGNQVFCPLAAVYSAIARDQDTWGYLIAQGDFKDKNRPRPAYGKIESSLVVNIIDANQPHLGVQIGMFSTGATTNIIDKKTGIIYQPNMAPNVDELISADYMAAYAYGDITHPANAPLLICEQGTDKGDFSPYRVTPAIGRDRKVMRMPVTHETMAQRVNLANPDSFLNIPTPEDLVQSLVRLLNGRSPAGYHEYALLRMALPDFKIPEPPPAPGAIHSVSGFSPSPATSPHDMPARTLAQAPAPAPAPQANAPQTAQAPNAAQWGQAPQTWPEKAASPMNDEQPVANADEAWGQPAAATATYSPATTAAPAAGARVPGDPVPEFDEKAFLARIRRTVKS